MKETAVLKYPLPMRIGMGLDGGGTKTDCLLMDHTGRILGSGRGSASNPSRIGLEAAARGVMEAANEALRDARMQMGEVTDVCAGLAGVALRERADTMTKLLSNFFAPLRFELCTDLDLALGATHARPAIVLVAGTGSAAIGQDAAGQIARSGGYGPKKSDEGSAFAIGKRAVNEVTAATGVQAGNLRARIFHQLGVQSLEGLVGLEGAEADDVYPRVFPVVANAADEGSEIARQLLLEAAKSLAGFVADVQGELKLNNAGYLLGKTGGMIGRSKYFDEALDAQLLIVAPHARLEILRTPLVEVAARRALSL